ncbi:MAG: N-acetyl-gamma-glutamyl-phosphate reductase [Ruminococcaceae bacterium]|nr:N-acetyl-gamma-glutamyl-phosphate reductase [Oscillospiraceae bacterium]
MTKVFIDGSQGTTGLRIFDRLSLREDIELITLKESERKDLSCRIKAINSSDITFLCLPDEAAIEAVSHADEKVKILDTSTAHRTNEQWIYGFPEVFENGLEKVKGSNRVAVPGCHASGYIALIKPLIDNGILSKDTLLTCHSVTGYSGGGKKMIAEYENPERDFLLDAPRQYGLTQQHKHLKEMRIITGTENLPIFCPIVSDFYSGMCVTVPLFKAQLKKGGIEDIKSIYKNKYQGPIVNFVDQTNEGGFISANGIKGKDSMQIFVLGNEDRILLIARYDNLGKGASGAALQCMNIMMGADITTGLDL